MLKRLTRKMIRTTVQHVKKRKRTKKRRKNEKKRKLVRQVYAIFVVKHSLFDYYSCYIVAIWLQKKYNFHFPLNYSQNLRARKTKMMIDQNVHQRHSCYG